MLTLIGYWKGASAAQWPAAEVWVDPNWDPEERHAVIEWLRSGERVRSSMGWSTCRFCDRPNGTDELSDGSYIWPEGLEHYLVEHQVRLPRAVIQRACERPEIPRNRLQDSDIGSGDIHVDWWRQLKPDWPNTRA